MISKLLAVIAIFVVVLAGRENPFLPFCADTAAASAQLPSAAPLPSQTLLLPQDARILKRLDATYQRFDGTTGTMSKIIDQEVDWRTPIVISQNNRQKTSVSQTGHPQTETAAGVTIQTNVGYAEALRLADPDRFVIDIKTSAVPKVRWQRGGAVLRVVQGRHAGFIRTVFYLQAGSKPSLHRSNGGYRVDF